MNSAAITTSFGTLKDKATAYFKRLSTREKVSLVVVALFLSAIAALLIWQPIRQSFDRQTRKIALLNKNMSDMRTELTKYSELKSRLDSVEARFKRGNSPGRLQTLLEKLIEEKTGLPPDKVTIKRFSKRKIGEQFELTPYSVSFETTNLSHVVGLLEALNSGPRPVPITKLQIQKSRRMDKLSVTIDVSSIRDEE